MKSTATFKVLDKDTIEIYAPDFEAVGTAIGCTVLFLDKEDRRVCLGWINTTDKPDVYTSNVRNEFALTTYEMDFYDDDVRGVCIPDVYYYPSEDTPVEQIVADLPRYFDAALKWKDQGYPLPPKEIEIPDVAGAVIDDAVTMGDKDTADVAALGNDGFWYGRWNNRSRAHTDEIYAFVYEGQRYVRDGVFMNGNARFIEDTN